MHNARRTNLHEPHCAGLALPTPPPRRQGVPPAWKDDGAGAARARRAPVRSMPARQESRVRLARPAARPVSGRGAVGAGVEEMAGGTSTTVYYYSVVQL